MKRPDRVNKTDLKNAGYNSETLHYSVERISQTQERVLLSVAGFNFDISMNEVLDSFINLTTDFKEIPYSSVRLLVYDKQLLFFNISNSVNFHDCSNNKTYLQPFYIDYLLQLRLRQIEALIGQPLKAAQYQIKVWDVCITKNPAENPATVQQFFKMFKTYDTKRFELKTRNNEQRKQYYANHSSNDWNTKKKR